MQRRALWLIVGFLGVGALVALVFGGGLLLLLSLFANKGALTAAETLPVAGIVALGLGLGVPLAWQGWAGWHERPSRPFGPPRIWWLWLALVLLIGLGAVVSLLPLAPALLLPPIHVLTMALLPLLVLGLVGRTLRGTAGSWREVIAGMAGGGFLGTGAAMVGEFLLALFAAIVILVGIAMLAPDGSERLTELASNLQDPTWLEDMTNMVDLLLSPTVIVSALGLFSIAVPLLEEALKTLTAGVVGHWIRPSPARAFLWGVAAGAGFALAENMLNGALGGVEGWVLVAVGRVGATVMHCCTGGLVGWGWGQLWAARRPLRLVGAYALAVVAHGLWNAAAIGATLLGASASVHEGEGLWLILTNLGTLALVGGLAVLATVFLTALLLAGRRLANAAQPSPEQASAPDAFALEPSEASLS